MRSDADAAMDRLFDLAVVLGDLMNRHLAEHGLTPARAEVIWLLHREGPRTQRELSQALKCTPRNVTGLVDALQDARLVARSPHPTDRRAVRVSLTERGETLATGWRTGRDASAGQLFAGTSAADLATAIAVLDRVLDRLRASYPAS